MPTLVAPVAQDPRTSQAAEPSRGECALAELRPGSRGRVARVLGEAADIARLQSMGVCQGRLVEVLRSGDAWIVRVLGSRVGISQRLAASVLVVAA
ncbi:MAG: FeoA family protein [Lacipirellulaceae bacterium]